MNNGKTKNFCCADKTEIFPMALGSMYFGTQIRQETAEELMTRYVSMGGNQIDTARSYASWIDGRSGASEESIGKWLKKYGKREHLFIGTKGGLMPRGYNADRGNLDYAHLRGELQESLAALQTDYVDVFWLHRDERTRPAAEIIDTCDSLVRDGMARYIGASNWSVERIKEANEYAEKNGKTGISMSQIQFGIGRCTPQAWGDDSVVCMDEASYQWYKSEKLPLYAYSAQAQGFFQTVIEKGAQALREDTRQKYLSEINLRRAGKMKEIHEKTGISVTAMVLQYVLSGGLDAALILGCSRPKRLTEAFCALQEEIPESIWEELISGESLNPVPDL